MFNKIILEGWLTRDVEMRYSASGVAMAKSTIAVNKKFTVNGEKKEKTLFVTIQLWKRSAEIFNQYCRKGSHILVEGELENNDYIDNQGVKKFGYIVNISNLQMLDSKNDVPQQGQQQPQYEHENIPSDNQQPSQGQQMQNNSVPEIDIDEENLPF